MNGYLIKSLIYNDSRVCESILLCILVKNDLFNQQKFLCLIYYLIYLDKNLQANSPLCNKSWLNFFFFLFNLEKKIYNTFKKLEKNYFMY